MNHRSKEILRLLIEKSDVLLSELMEIHEVSERTIRNDISSLNDYLDNLQFGRIRIKQKQVSIQLAVSKHVLYQDMNRFDVYEYKFSSSERSLICLLLLIRHKGYVTLNQLSEKLLASRSTIVNDVKSMRELAASHRLTIISKANKGYRLLAKEEDIRLFLYSILSQEQLKVLTSVIFDEGYEEEVGLAYLQEQLNENKERLQLSEKLLNRLLYYLLISIYRNQRGFFLKTKLEVDNIAFLDVMTEIFLQDQQLPLSKRDIAFICSQVTDREPSDLLEDVINKESIRIQVTSMKFIEKISADLRIDFKDDYIFYENFSAHILRMLRKEEFQADMGLSIEGVVRSNPKIQEVVRKHLPIIEENIGRKASQTELNYIIIHVYAAMERKKRIGSNLKVAVLTEKKSTEAFFIESKLMQILYMQ